MTFIYEITLVDRICVILEIMLNIILNLRNTANHNVYTSNTGIYMPTWAPAEISLGGSPIKAPYRDIKGLQQKNKIVKRPLI